MAIRWTSVAVTTDALGAGTATTAAPVIGEIREIRVNAVQYSATADYSVIRQSGVGGGTVAYVVNNNGPFSAAPGIPAYSTGDGAAVGGAGGTVVFSPVSDGPLTVRIAQGGNAQSGTTYIYYDDRT